MLSIEAGECTTYLNEQNIKGVHSCSQQEGKNHDLLKQSLLLFRGQLHNEQKRQLVAVKLFRSHEQAGCQAFDQELMMVAGPESCGTDANAYLLPER
ncbi:hypothetical protein M0R45_023532 [Rubus argutus]|uniref:Uncharacterized protein n=1 Tax=Rubus argutus TaxID=59490 RepID=A0AAW1WRL2_RUBAR